MTFTNWLTADPLGTTVGAERPGGHGLDRPDAHARHEPLAGRLLRVATTPTRTTRTFLQARQELRRYRRPDGKVDPYAGYLHDLRAHHQGQAVMITEFGVPTAIGVAHRGPLGRDQGDHSEQEAGRMNADMMRDIAAGGLRRRAGLRVDRRVVQVHLEHAGARAARGAPAAVAQRADQRGALRHRRRGAGGEADAR